MLVYILLLLIAARVMSRDAKSICCTQHINLIHLTTYAWRNLEVILEPYSEAEEEDCARSRAASERGQKLSGARWVKLPQEYLRRRRLELITMHLNIVITYVSA